MADNQKYYYMRLKEGFFDDDVLKIIEAMPDGYLYSNILLKLYLKSLKYNGKLMFNERIPYNPEVLATITRHQVGTIEKALKLFKELDLIDILDNGAIYMLDIQNFIGKSNTEADRKREYRAKIAAQKAKLLTDGQMSGQCPLEIEKEIEKEIETEINESQNDSYDDSFEQSSKKQSKKKKEAAPYVDDNDLNAAIIAFIEYRKKIKKPMTDRAIELLINELNKLSSDIVTQIAILNQSILHGWQGVFPLKETHQQGRQENVPLWMREKDKQLQMKYRHQEEYEKNNGTWDDIEKDILQANFDKAKAEAEARIKEICGKEE